MLQNTITSKVKTTASNPIQVLCTHPEEYLLLEKKKGVHSMDIVAIKFLDH
jgi:hypothetical protein